MQFLNQDEMLLHTPELIMWRKGRAMPQTVQEILMGKTTLWERIVEILRRSKDGELEDLQRDMNLSLEEVGAWNRINLWKDEYLNLLNPAVVTDPGWGIAPQIYMDKLNAMEINPQVWITADDQEAQDPNLPYYLADDLMSPLHLPPEYR